MTNIDPATGLPQLPKDYRFNVALRDGDDWGGDFNIELTAKIEKLKATTTGHFFWKKREEHWLHVWSGYDYFSSKSEVTPEAILALATRTSQGWEEYREEKRAGAKAHDKIAHLLGPYPPNRLDTATDTE